jgi:hypothetical protein
MKHEPKDFQRLIAQCRGFLSEVQLAAHFELYQGYVKKLNEIEEKLKTAPADAASRSPTTAPSCTSCTSRTSGRRALPFPAASRTRW